MIDLNKLLVRPLGLSWVNVNRLVQEQVGRIPKPQYVSCLCVCENLSSFRAPKTLFVSNQVRFTWLFDNLCIRIIVDSAGRVVLEAVNNLRLVNVKFVTWMDILAILRNAEAGLFSIEK